MGNGMSDPDAWMIRRKYLRHGWGGRHIIETPHKRWMGWEDRNVKRRTLPWRKRWRWTMRRMTGDA